MFNLYHLVAWIYEAAPVAAIVWTILLVRRTGSVKPVRIYIMLAVGALLLGMMMALMREGMFGSAASAWQLARACYWMLGLLWILRAVSLVSEWLLLRAVKTRAFQRTKSARLALLGLAALSRAVIVFVVSVALMLATLLGYRPGFTHAGDPSTILHARFETINLVATDGTHLSAWWIAAPDVAQDVAPSTELKTTSATRPATASVNVNPNIANQRETILFCHGLGSDKAEQLPAVRGLYAAGYNILAIDLRGHGQSGGSLTTFGDLERLDVLAAVHWLRTTQPAHARRILGLGVNLGSAALLGAAADESDDGQAIDAIAAIEPFDRASGVMQDLGERTELAAIGWLAARVALPSLRLQCGAMGEPPEDDVALLWPRPLFVVEGSEEGVALDQNGQARRTRARAGRNRPRAFFKDGLVPPQRAQALFDAAMQPKYAWWVDEKNTRQILLKDPQTLHALRAFFGGARSVL